MKPQKKQQEKEVIDTSSAANYNSNQIPALMAGPSGAAANSDGNLGPTAEFKNLKQAADALMAGFGGEAGESN